MRLWKDLETSLGKSSAPHTVCIPDTTSRDYSEEIQHYAGARNFAVEIGTNEQAAMDYFVQTGQVDQFDSNVYRQIVMRRVGVQALYREAARVGMSVVCVNQPTRNRTTSLSREQYMAEQLLALQSNGGGEEKTLVWIGGQHAINSQIPFPSLRTWLQNAGFETSSIILESQSIIDLEDRHHLDRAAIAFRTYFEGSVPDASFAYPTSQIGLSTLLISPLEGPGPRRNDSWEIPYSQAHEYVAFLSPRDGGDQGLARGFR